MQILVKIKCEDGAAAPPNSKKENMTKLRSGRAPVGNGAALLAAAALQPILYSRNS
jgi:hypothetical protein